MLIAQDPEEGLFPKMKTVIFFALPTAAVRAQAIAMSSISGAVQDTNRGTINCRTPHRLGRIFQSKNRYQAHLT